MDDGGRGGTMKYRDEYETSHYVRAGGGVHCGQSREGIGRQRLPELGESHASCSLLPCCHV